MASQNVKIIQTLNTTDEMRKQTRLIMQPYANWEEYLTPAPCFIAIMEVLFLISSQTDFSINKYPPKDGYKCIKYPESFCACLMQVCNSSQWAFNNANKNMDQIRLYTMTFPDNIKNAVKILFQGNDEVAQAHLPGQLENSRVIADECLVLAEATEKWFNDVTDIIIELLEACIRAKHFYGEELDEIKKEILCTSRSSQVKEIGLNTTIKMLVKSMDALARVKEQWEKMTKFFQMMSNIVKIILSISLKNVVLTSKETQSLYYNGRLFSKDLLYTQAFQATNIANFVHMISQTYTEVSNKYLMDHISSLGRFVTKDKEKPEFEQERQQLLHSCDDAQKAILQLVLKNKAEFERNSDSRIQKIDQELLDILPPAAPEEKKNIQEAVKSWFTEEDEEQYC